MSISSQLPVAFTTLGDIHEEWDIPSTLAPFRRASEAKPVKYPRVVVEALGNLFAEYNQVMAPIGATEWESDYGRCDPAAFAVQIDMAGLEGQWLEQLASMPVMMVEDVLRDRIFEIDSSIAMYPLLERLFAQGGTSEFQTGWRRVLDDLRCRHDMPIALLAVTDQKYDAMLATEFGITSRQEVSSEVVRDMTGFDAFFSPDAFRAHLDENGGESQYLLFVRASDPIDKLRRPDTVVDHPILGDDNLRRVVRANTITKNVDNPSAHSVLWVNDTKAYMPLMGLGYAVTDYGDLSSAGFGEFLFQRGLKLEDVQSGQVMLRAKPLIASYGGYGHVRGVVTDKRFRRDLRQGLNQRGAYIVQPEIPTAMVADRANGITAGYIDRVFFGWVAGEPYPIGGFRNFMPVGSGELEAGRIHGGSKAFWVPIGLR